MFSKHSSVLFFAFILCSSATKVTTRFSNESTLAALSAQYGGYSTLADAFLDDTTALSSQELQLSASKLYSFQSGYEVGLKIADYRSGDKVEVFKTDDFRKSLRLQFDYTISPRIAFHNDGLDFFFFNHRRLELRKKESNGLYDGKFDREIKWWREEHIFDIVKATFPSGKKLQIGINEAHPRFHKMYCKVSHKFLKHECKVPEFIKECQHLDESFQRNMIQVWNDDNVVVIDATLPITYMYGIKPLIGQYYSVSKKKWCNLPKLSFERGAKIVGIRAVQNGDTSTIVITAKAFTSDSSDLERDDGRKVYYYEYSLAYPKAAEAEMRSRLRAERQRTVLSRIVLGSLDSTMPCLEENKFEEWKVEEVYEDMVELGTIPPEFAENLAALA